MCMCVYTKNTSSQSWGEEAEEKAKQKLTELLQKQGISYAGLLWASEMYLHPFVILEQFVSSSHFHF